jgi:hypothetical protein
MRRMEVEKHKPSIIKSLLGVRESIVLTKKSDFNLNQFVKDKLKGSLD